MVHTRCLINKHTSNARHQLENNKIGHLCGYCITKPDLAAPYKKLKLDQDIIVEAEKCAASTLKTYTEDQMSFDTQQARFLQQQNSKLAGYEGSILSPKPRRRKAKFMKKTSKSSKLQKRHPETILFQRIKKFKTGKDFMTEVGGQTSDKSVENLTPLTVKSQKNFGNRQRINKKKRPSGLPSSSKSKKEIDKQPKIRGFNLSNIVGKQDEIEGKPWVEWKLVEKGFFKPTSEENTQDMMKDLLQRDQNTNMLLERDVRECWILKDVMDTNKTHLIKTLISRKHKIPAENSNFKGQRFNGIGYFRLVHKRGSQTSATMKPSDDNEKQSFTESVNLQSSLDMLEMNEPKKIRFQDYSNWFKATTEKQVLPDIKLRAFIPISSAHLTDLTCRQDKFTKVFRKLNSNLKSTGHTCGAHYNSKSELYYLRERENALTTSVENFLLKSSQTSMQ